jgi:transcriptional regulator with XRE-family HTH domain
MLGKALLLLRRFKGLSQTEISDKLGVGKSWISEIEAEKKEPTLQLLNGYAEVLDIPVSSILFFSEEMANGSRSERARTFVSRKVLAVMDYIDAHSREEAEDEDATQEPPPKTVPASQAGKSSAVGGHSAYRRRDS